MDETTIPEPRIARFLLSDRRLAAAWGILRIGVGTTWLTEGLEKLSDPRGQWVGSAAGGSLAEVMRWALTRTGGEHPDVPLWYADFLRSVVLPHAAFFGRFVTYAEIIVGLALILGVLTGFAAFAGGLLNASYLFAGIVALNPLLFIFSTWLVLAWRVAGDWGLDHFLLPRLGVPGAAGTWRRGPWRFPRERRA